MGNTDTIQWITQLQYSITIQWTIQLQYSVSI